MYQFIVENQRGEQLRLTQNGNYYLEVQGLNPPQASVITTKIAGMNGSLYNSASTNNRNLVLSIQILKNVETNRIALYDYLKVGEWVKCYYSNNSRNVYIEGYVETFEDNFFVQNQTVQASIVCPQPYFRQIDDVISDISNVSYLFEFPFAIDEPGVAFSEFNEFLIANVINNGDITTGIIIQLTASGTVENPSIINAGTRERFILDFTMVAGDLITINTVEGQMDITLLRDGIESNIINSVVDGSVWLQVPAGTSSYTYRADTGLDDLRITFQPVTLYQGV